MAYQQGIELPCPGGESWRVETGGSVATAALDILIKWGGNPIIFLGQDLAYTGGHTHVEDCTYGNEQVAVERSLLVEGLEGGMVPTSRSLNRYRSWIEQRIAREQARKFINATAAGARISGTEEKSLDQIKEEILQFEYDQLKEFKINSRSGRILFLNRD